MTHRARRALQAVIRVTPAHIAPPQRAEMVQLATKITAALLQQRIRPDDLCQQFDVWGREDANGVNLTLRHDVVQFGSDAKRLKLITTIHQGEPDSSANTLTRAQLNALRLIARYHAFIKSNWSITPGTQEVFESTRRMILGSLPAGSAAVVEELRKKDLVELARLPHHDVPTVSE